MLGGHIEVESAPGARLHVHRRAARLLGRLTARRPSARHPPAPARAGGLFIKLDAMSTFPPDHHRFQRRLHRRGVRALPARSVVGGRVLAPVLPRRRVARRRSRRGRRRRATPGCCARRPAPPRSSTRSASTAISPCQLDPLGSAPPGARGADAGVPRHHRGGSGRRAGERARLRGGHGGRRRAAPARGVLRRDRLRVRAPRQRGRSARWFRDVDGARHAHAAAHRRARRSPSSAGSPKWTGSSASSAARTRASSASPSRAPT